MMMRVKAEALVKLGWVAAWGACAVLFPEATAVGVLLIALSSLLILADRRAERVQDYARKTRSFEIKSQNLYTRLEDGGAADSGELRGFRPYHQPNTRVEGAITFPALRLNYAFHYTTDEAGRRMTAPSRSSASGPIIAVFGCSQTWGTALPDEETFPWLLQERLQGYRVINYGVAGFSPYQITLLIERVLKSEHPTLVVFAHYSFGDVRSLGRYPHTAWYRGPRCMFLAPLRSLCGRLYKLPGRNPSEIVLGIKTPALRAIGHALLACPLLPMNSKRVAVRTSQHLLLGAKNACEKRGIKFVTLTLESRGAYSRFFEENGFSWCEFNTACTGSYWDPEYTLAPFDEHYNRKATEVIAARLADAISKTLCGGRACSALQTTEEPAHEQLTGLIYPLF